MEQIVLMGRVEHGKEIGRTLGAPTLNFDSKPDGLEFGVYLGVTSLAKNRAGEQKKYSSVAHCGPRPTFHETEPVLEVHLLDFAEELYDQEVTFEFLIKIREVKRFESPEALKGQIQSDIRRAREFFA